LAEFDRVRWFCCLHVVDDPAPAETSARSDTCYAASTRSLTFDPGSAQPARRPTSLTAADGRGYRRATQRDLRTRELSSFLPNLAPLRRGISFGLSPRRVCPSFNEKVILRLDDRALLVGYCATGGSAHLGHPAASCDGWFFIASGDRNTAAADRAPGARGRLTTTDRGD
jgi:hypothetical protein